MQINFSDVDSLLPFRCLAPGGINSSLSSRTVTLIHRSTRLLFNSTTFWSTFSSRSGSRLARLRCLRLHPARCSAHYVLLNHSVWSVFATSTSATSSVSWCLSTATSYSPKTLDRSVSSNAVWRFSTLPVAVCSIITSSSSALLSSCS
jgi:hypothetical protein